ncbi:MAG: signal peptidase I [Verrucomicrobiota bacterium]
MFLPHQPNESAKQNRRSWQIGVLLFGFSVLLFRTSVADWSLVPSGSMQPTIVEGDIVLSDKLAYDLRIPLTPWRIFRNDPKRGEIAVFKSPESRQTLVKRVIGVPGDTLSMEKGILFLNGVPASYQPLSSELFQDLPPRSHLYAHFVQEVFEEGPHSIMITPGAPPKLRNISEITVPEGEYFVLGDNRDFSHDSRMYGFVERKKFLGRVTSVLFSFRKGEEFELRDDRFLHALH